MARKIVTYEGLAYTISKIQELMETKAMMIHDHDASDITSGRLSLDRLPTSVVPNRILRVGNANTSPIYDRVNLQTDVTNVLSIYNGGTGGTSLTEIWENLQITYENLGAAPLDHTHGPDNMIGILPVSKGGTGAGSFPSGAALVGDGLNQIQYRMISSSILSNTSSNLVTEGSVKTELDKKANSDHDHDIGDIISGTLPVEKGGTGASTSGEARENLDVVARAGDTMRGILDFTTNGGIRGSLNLLNKYKITGKNDIIEPYNLDISTSSDPALQNGDDSIFMSQYESDFTVLKRRVTILDRSGNTQFPGTVTAVAFTGNASSATRLRTPRNVQVDLTSGDSVLFDGSVDINPGVTGTLPINRGGTGANNITDARNNLGISITNLGAAPIDHTHTKAEVGLGNADNTADVNKTVAAANRLVTPRTVRTNLSSTTTASFDGSTNITPGVTGFLPIENGGTGASNAADARINLGLTSGSIGAAPLVHQHNAGDINSGILNIARIPTGTSAGTVASGAHTHNASNVNAGVLDIARIPTGVTGSTVALGNHSHTNGDILYCYPTQNVDSYFYRGTTNPTGTTRLNYSGHLYATMVIGAGWNNDYAEMRKSIDPLLPGQVSIENGSDTVRMSNNRLEPGPMIVSDTYGILLGPEEDDYYPMAIAGRVLAYTYEDRNLFQIGDPVCTGPHGTVSIMTREEVKEWPDRILGIVSSIPDYDVWQDRVKINNRIWITIK